MKLREKLQSHPDYEKYTQLIDQIDTEAPPQIVYSYRCHHPINESEKKLGIFSGSFNPITVAHIKMIEEACKYFQLDEMLLLLAKSNVDKEVFGLSLADRIIILNRYAEEQEHVSVGISSHGRYIDKVDALKRIYPLDTEFYFIVGYDTLVRIFDPKYYNDIHTELQHLFSQCKFIVANRDNVDIKTIRHFMSQASNLPYSSCVSYLTLPDVYAGISSTDVRQRLLDEKPISHLVPSFVVEMLASEFLSL